MKTIEFIQGEIKFLNNLIEISASFKTHKDEYFEGEVHAYEFYKKHLENLLEMLIKYAL